MSRWSREMGERLTIRHPIVMSAIRIVVFGLILYGVLQQTDVSNMPVLEILFIALFAILIVASFVTLVKGILAWNRARQG